MRNIVSLTGLIVVAYSLLVALLPLVLHDEPRPPWWLGRPMALFGLLSLPAVIGGIGAMRGTRPMVVAAGVICLLQSFVAFSGITFGFIVPALMFLPLGAAERWPQAARPRRTTLVAGIVVILLAAGAWTSLLMLTGPRCYSFSRQLDRSLIFTEVPATDTQLHGPARIIGDGGGCGSSELTVQGMGVSAVLAFGAIALATISGSSRRADPSPLWSAPQGDR